MKYFFKRDTLLATLSVFFVMGFFMVLPLNLHVLDPMKIALADIDFNDLSFSVLKTHRNNAMDDKIVIVNIGDTGRTGIAAILRKVNEAQPKVIGLDVLFPAPMDPAADSALAGAIAQAPNIVLSNKLEFGGNTSINKNYFSGYSQSSGYVNFVGENSGVIRYFSPFEKWKDSLNYSFAAAVIKASDELRFRSFQKRSNELEVINYRRQADQYFTVDYHDLLADKVNPAVFNNKIVLMGLVDNNPSNIEDKHFTPLNEKFMGKSIPDMNGVIIHANIISMILENNYIKRTPAWLNWLIAWVLTWIFMALIIKFHIEPHTWFHVAAKIIQLLTSVLFLYLGIALGQYLNVYVSLSASLVGIFLSVDVLYFYECFAKWANKKYGFKSIFIKAHHK